MSITVTDVVSQFGAYYIKGSQAEKDLYKLLYNQTDISELFTLMPGTDTLIRKSDARLTEIVQPYQDAFTPKGALTFKPVEIALFEMKIDIQENPSKLEASWLGFLTGEGIDRKSWPFVRWYMEVHIIRQKKRDMEKQAYFAGVYGAPTAGTAGAANTVMNGINKVRKTHITNSRTTPITIGAPSTDPVTWCEQVETFVNAIDEDARQEDMVIAMSKVLHRRYRAGKRKKYNAYYDQTPELNLVTDNDNISVKGYDSMSGSSVIWTSPKWNNILGQKRSNAGFQVENVDRNVKIFTDWWEGLGFIIPEYLFTNDSDLPS